jgi:regulator of sigma E protease
LALKEGVLATWFWLVAIITAVVGLFKQLFGGPSMGLDFAGPVGIAVLTGQAAKMGWIYVLQFTALLSLNLAIINILPFPALDGGRILFLAIEKIRGKAVDSKLENIFHNIGFILLMILIVAITYRDLVRYGAKILSALGRIIGWNI